MKARYATLLAIGVAMILGSVAVAHEGEHFSAGEPGEAKKPARIVPVTMKETSDGKMLFFPNSIEVRKGEQVRFVITNAGAVTHEFVLASKTDNDKHAALMQKYPDMEHDDPNGKTLQPGQKAEMIWKFSKAGTFEFACLIPGHREAGMLGSVNVK
jgi:uncharacterized cupredoxin-like copper-binding protein